MTRRAFVSSSGVALAAATTRLPIRKAVLLSMLPTSMSVADRFKLAMDCGFEQIECPTTEDPGKAEEIKRAADGSGLRIHSVMNQAHWKYPLSSGDPAVVATSVKGMETSLRNAHFWGADTVLLVPAVVNPQTSYHDAWVRSQNRSAS
jgi:hexulose-6-phosphate isomerase